MRKYSNAEKVPKGVYFNLSTWELIQLHGETLVLPGRDRTHYLKVPTALAIVGGPVSGLAFILFLPFIGIVGGIGFLVYKIARWTRDRVRSAIRPTAVNWSPTRAYLVRKGRTHAQREKREERDEHLNKMGDEITERRQNGEE